MYIEIDYEKLRSDLIDYYGSAMTCNPMAVIELYNVQTASNEKLVQIAIKNGFNLYDYEKGKTKSY